MPFKHFNKFQLILAYTIGIALVYFIASSTRISFDKAREQFNKDRLGDIESALNFMLFEKTNFNKTFELCVNNWCEVNDDLLAKMVNNNTDPPSKILIEVPKTASGKSFSFKVIGSDSYVIQGPSHRKKSLCWTISTNKKNSNISKGVPTDCL